MLFLYACASDVPANEDYKPIGENEKQNTELPSPKKENNKDWSGEDLEDYFGAKENEMPKADIPTYNDLLTTSSIYMQDKIKPAKRADAVVEYLSEKNDKALISLKLLKDKSFQLQTILLEEDIPLILVGAYLQEGNTYYLQFTDSDLCKKFFDPSVNKNPQIEMLSSSELEFPQSLNTINIFGIPCHKQ